MRIARLGTAVTVAASTVVLLAGCGEDAIGGDDGGAADSDAYELQLYGTDGIMQNSFGAEVSEPSVLHGTKGTVPMNPLPTAFRERLRGVDSSVDGFLFAGEAYDAVVISALAAEFAGTPDPGVVREHIPHVTFGGTECDEVAECLELAREGTHLAYQGVSMDRGGLTVEGEPSVGTYATQYFGREGTLDEDKTQYVGAGRPVTSEESPPEPGDQQDVPAFSRDPLVLGGLLPESGELSHAYPPIGAGVTLAVQEVNDAGGVFERDVEWVDGDSGTNPETARETLESHLDEGVHVLIGAAASGVSEALLPDVVAAERILFSPSNTAAGLGDEAEGWYFRTAPPDELQGEALADIVLRDGTQEVSIVARDDVYGRGLRESVREALEGLGMPASDIRVLSYEVPEEEGAPVVGMDALVAQIAESPPEGLLMIGFSEASQLIEGLVTEGLLGSER